MPEVIIEKVDLTIQLNAPTWVNMPLILAREANSLGITRYDIRADYNILAWFRYEGRAEIEGGVVEVQAFYDKVQSLLTKHRGIKLIRCDWRQYQRVVRR